MLSASPAFPRTISRRPDRRVLEAMTSRKMSGCSAIVGGWIRCARRVTIPLVKTEKIGQAVRRWRRRRGLTQAALAMRAGLSRPFVARVETARQIPSLPTLVKLARALRVKVGRLVE